jgi:putative alpha-1,2-mannosidase
MAGTCFLASLEVSFQKINYFGLNVFTMLIRSPGPFAPVKLGPDFLYGKGEAYAGYLPDTGALVTGFSMMHQSGIGGAPKYGVVSQMPVPGSVQNPLINLSVKRAQPDQGSVGYYKSVLANGVTVELAATNHAGFYQYTFPKEDQSSVVIDVSHLLQSFRGMNWGQSYTGGSFTIASDGHYEGSGIYNKGWNLGKSLFLDVHFFV